MKAVIPIKGLDQAKQRLAPLLSAAERGALMAHMIDDVLTALSHCPGITGLVVISDDPEVQAQVRRYGARIMVEPPAEDYPANQLSDGAASEGARGFARLNQVYAMAVNILASEGEQGVLLLPADLPQISAADIEEMLEDHTRPGVTIVPAAADGGTNAMVLSPPEIIAPGFGELSCQRHCARARAKGIEARVLTLPGPGLDVDTVEDLLALMELPPGSATRAFLHHSGIAERLRDSSVDKGEQQVVA